MGRIANGQYQGIVNFNEEQIKREREGKINYNKDYTNFIEENFKFSDGRWVWKDQEYPKKDLMKRILSKWKAFRNKPTSKEEFDKNFDKIKNKVISLLDITIISNWNQEEIKGIYDFVKPLLCGSTMLTTKTLHFFVPDLFVIIDRKMIFPNLKKELPSLPNDINNIDGKKYVNVLIYFKDELNIAISNNIIRDIEDFRKQNTETISGNPYTLCKIIDKIMTYKY